MKYLSLELFEKKLKEAESINTIHQVPTGFEENFYKTFLRVLSSDFSALDDVPSEMIVEMLERGEELFASVSLNDETFQEIYGRLNAVTSTIKAQKRRIL